MTGLDKLWTSTVSLCRHVWAGRCKFYCKHFYAKACLLADVIVAPLTSPIFLPYLFSHFFLLLGDVNWVEFGRCKEDCFTLWISVGGNIHTHLFVLLCPLKFLSAYFWPSTSWNSYDWYCNIFMTAERTDHWNNLYYKSSIHDASKFFNPVLW